MGPTPLPDERRAGFEREALPHLDAVFRAARRLAGSADDADDLVQDTMISAYRAWHQYRPGTSARAWLLTILRNTFINEYRRRSARRDTTPLESIEAHTAGGAPSTADPEGAFYAALVDERVVRAIAALPATYREVFVLTDVEDLRYEDSARVLGVPVGTVKSRLSRARQMLRSQLFHYAVSSGWMPEAARRRGAA